MAEHANVQRVRDAYAAFLDGDLNNALKDLADDGVFHFTGEGPNAVITGAGPPSRKR